MFLIWIAAGTKLTDLVDIFDGYSSAVPHQACASSAIVGVLVKDGGPIPQKFPPWVVGDLIEALQSEMSQLRSSKTRRQLCSPSPLLGLTLQALVNQTNL